MGMPTPSGSAPALSRQDKTCGHTHTTTHAHTWPSCPRKPCIHSVDSMRCVHVVCVCVSVCVCVFVCVCVYLGLESNDLGRQCCLSLLDHSARRSGRVARARRARAAGGCGGCSPALEAVHAVVLCYLLGSDKVVQKLLKLCSILILVPVHTHTHMAFTDPTPLNLTPSAYGIEDCYNASTECTGRPHIVCCVVLCCGSGVRFVRSVCVWGFLYSLGREHALSQHVV